MLNQLDLCLSTPRLCLRPLKSGDEKYLWEHVTDPRITHYMAWSPHNDINQTCQFVENELQRIKDNKGITWAIFYNDDFCGIVSLIALLFKHRELIYNKAELSYWLAVKYQKQGIMTEACVSVSRFAFNNLALHKLCVSHFDKNIDSEGLIKRLGFRYIGKQKKEFKKNGIWYDHYLYELLDEEVSSVPIYK